MAGWLIPPATLIGCWLADSTAYFDSWLAGWQIPPATWIGGWLADSPGYCDRWLADSVGILIGGWLADSAGYFHRWLPASPSRVQLNHFSRVQTRRRPQFPSILSENGPLHKSQLHGPWSFSVPQLEVQRTSPHYPKAV